jgi:hypothetical protein
MHNGPSTRQKPTLRGVTATQSVYRNNSFNESRITRDNVDAICRYGGETDVGDVELE